MSDFRQTWKHVDYLRLEVGLPHPTEPNVLRTDNALGAFGWVTPYPGTAIEAWGSGNPPPGWGGGFWGGGFRLTTGSLAAADVLEFSTVPAPIAAGQWAASRLARYLTGGATATSVEIRTEFLNAAGAVTGFSASTTATVTAAAPAPAGTVSVRMVAKVLRAAVGTRFFYFNGEQIVTAATAAAANAAVTGYKPYVNSWVNVIAATHSIEIDRSELDVGTLTARVLDATIDPAVATLIRPGRPVRVNVANGFVWEPLFTGTLTEANVQYDLVRAARGDNRHAQITLAAVDNVTALGTQRMPYGVAEIAHLRSVLEGAGVPWNVNGNRNQLAAVIPAVSINDSATMLDQVAITRDSKAGFAWVDRRGVLNAFDKTTLDAVIVFGLRNLLTGVDPFANGNVTTTPGVSYQGATWTRVTVSTAYHGARALATLSDLVNGQTYTGSYEIANDGATPVTVQLDWVDDVPTVATLAPGERRRVYASGTGAGGGGTYDATYRFFDIALQAPGSVLVRDLMLTQGTERVAYFTGTVQQSLSEHQYSSLDLAFSTKHLINEVNIKSLEWDPADPTRTIEVPYGPYRDEASAREWGPQSREFTVHGLNLAAIQALALAILIRNKTPGVYATGMRVPILTPTHINQRALLDLYNLVAVGYESKRFNGVHRITGMHHTITERGWTIDFALAPSPAVQPPQATPAVRN